GDGPELVAHRHANPALADVQPQKPPDDHDSGSGVATGEAGVPSPADSGARMSSVMRPVACGIPPGHHPGERDSSHDSIAPVSLSAASASSTLEPAIRSRSPSWAPSSNTARATAVART